MLTMSISSCLCENSINLYKLLSEVCIILPTFPERHIFARACVSLRPAAQLDSRHRHLLPRRRQGQDRGRRATHEDCQVPNNLIDLVWFSTKEVVEITISTLTILSDFFSNIKSTE